MANVQRDAGSARAAKEVKTGHFRFGNVEVFEIAPIGVVQQYAARVNRIMFNRYFIARVNTKERVRDVDIVNLYKVPHRTFTDYSMGFHRMKEQNYSSKSVVQLRVCDYSHVGMEIVLAQELGRRYNRGLRHFLRKKDSK